MVFQKFKQRQSLGEYNQSVTEISENENCNKKIKNDIGSSQNKSHDKQKIQLLDKIIKTIKIQFILKRGNTQNIVKKTQKIQKYYNNEKFPNETFNTKT